MINYFSASPPEIRADLVSRIQKAKETRDWIAAKAERETGDDRIRLVAQFWATQDRLNRLEGYKAQLDKDYKFKGDSDA